MSSAVRAGAAGGLHDVAEHHAGRPCRSPPRGARRQRQLDRARSGRRPSPWRRASSESRVRGEQRQQLGVGAVGRGDDRVQQGVVLGPARAPRARPSRIASTRSSGWAVEGDGRPRRGSGPSSCRTIASASPAWCRSRCRPSAGSPRPVGEPGHRHPRPTRPRGQVDGGARRRARAGSAAGAGCDGVARAVYEPRPPADAASRDALSASTLAGHRHEVDLLAHAAVGAAPVVGDVGPGRAGREALALVAGRHLVDVAAARARAAASTSSARTAAAAASPAARGPAAARPAPAAAYVARIRSRLRGLEVGPGQVAVEVGEHPRVHHPAPERRARARARSSRRTRSAAPGDSSKSRSVW